MSLWLPESTHRYSPPHSNQQSTEASSPRKSSRSLSAKVKLFRNMPSRSLIPFHHIPTTLLALTTYVVITVLFLVVLFVPPKNIPDPDTQRRMDIDVDAAWRDLQHITGYFGYHPYNSRANDKVREYLLGRIYQIVKDNKGGAEVEIVDDIVTNVTFAGDGVVPNQGGGLSVYFEGTNIVAVIKGNEAGREKLGAVLVNSHYDSVSTGYGVTDDGTAVVSLLQLLSYFTSPNLREDLRPKRDLLLLWNNGEEDYLNGARAFAVSPLANVPKIFHNLEGAGAGGRATLFRSTDTEVTSFYKNVKRPFGTSVSADGFKRGLIRSQTDYKVFTEDLGMRGLDIAFWRPRSRYHTQDDDVRHSSKESLWHMLGGSIETVQAMVIDTRQEFEAPFEKGGTAGVWFDIFGRAFALLRLRTLFAITITLLTVTPFIIGSTIYALYRNDQFYMFSNSRVNGKPIKGWRGFFSFPIVFILATAAVMATAYLIVKVNPMVAYGHLYLVWACFISEWFVVAWFITRLLQWWRPSALTRGYVFAWQWIFWYAVLIYTAALEDRKGVTAGYFIPVYYTGAFLCFWISLLEQFSLLRKDEEPVTTTAPYSPAHSYHTISSAGHLYSSSIEPINNAAESPSSVEPDERTGLLPRSDAGRPWPTFRRVLNGYRARRDDSPSSTDGEENSETETAPHRVGVYGHEQRWSKNLPGWTWILQWFLFVPMQVILVGQVGIFFGEAVHQTGADGNDLLPIYLVLALFAMLYWMPLTPFLQRVHYYVFVAMALAWVVSLVMTLAAFPFDEAERLKVYFQQTVELGTGKNLVHLVGERDFLREVVGEIPSAVGKEITCGEEKVRKGLWRCSWEGLRPFVAEGEMEKWLEYRIGETERRGDEGKERKGWIEVVGSNSRACKVLFDRPVKWVGVEGVRFHESENGGEEFEAVDQAVHSKGVASSSPYKNPVPQGGTSELRLWSREWSRGWRVDYKWSGEADERMTGNVVCLWADANIGGVIPALDEVMRFMPSWSVVSKLGDGLVEGWAAF